MARLVLANASGVEVASKTVTLAAPPTGDPHPNPPFSTGGFTVSSNTDVDLGWQQYASFWCDNKNDWTRRRFIIDGRGVYPNVNQIEPKVFGAQRFKLSRFVVRYIASASSAEMQAAGKGSDVQHTEGIYLGSARDGILEYGYFGFNEGTSAAAVFFTGFPYNLPAARIDFVKCRFDLAGLTGNGKTHWNGPIFNTFDVNGGATQVRFIDCQARVGAPGALGNVTGGLGAWTYGGSSTGGSGKGFLAVPVGAAWPAFPDGTQGPPEVFA